MKKLCFFLFLFFSFSYARSNPGISNLTFQQFSSSNGLPDDEVQQIYQDKSGYIWIGTRSGLFKYDGYKVREYKSALSSPNLLTSNNIQCMVNDDRRQLWIGTNNGLNILNEVTGEIRKIMFRGWKSNNLISCLLARRNGRIWIGTDGGLYQYDPRTGKFGILFNISGNSTLPRSAVKSLMEDSKGDVWVGTWDKGLFRYDDTQKRFIEYPQFNPRKSTHSLCEDSQGRIWIGTWNYGLYCLENPREMDRLQWKHYEKQDAQNGLVSNFIYSLEEEHASQTLWIGTSSGLSILDLQKEEFTNYKYDDKQRHIPCNEVTSILRDRSGLMWVSTIGGGALYTNTRVKPFHNVALESTGNRDLSTNGIRSLMVDRENRIWAGTGIYGFIIYDCSSKEIITWKQMPEFSDFSWVAVASCMLQRKSGDICIGTFGGGLISYRKGEKAKSYATFYGDNFLNSDGIYSLCEDADGNLLIGSAAGLSVLTEKGEGLSLNHISSTELEKGTIRSIIRGRNGSFWLGSSEHGVIRLEGNPASPSQLRLSLYNSKNRKLPVKGIQKVLRDSSGRVWATSPEGGLFLYDEKEDRFLSVNAGFNIPGELVYSIEEDKEGCLWLSTNYGLVRLKINKDLTDFSTRTFTTTDGLQSNFYITQASCRHNDNLYFGSYKGFSYFNPKDIDDNSDPAPVLITDIRIFNQPFASLAPDVRKKISAQMPGFTNHITLSANQNNFSIEFSSLSYEDPKQNLYAYKLEGYDRDWQQADANHRLAYYNNLPSGTYTFHLKATNSSGIWHENPEVLSVVIKPPFWATWWAYVLYVFLIAGIIWYTYSELKRRAMLRNRLRLQDLEKEKIEELNHNKLQFFTNITHELMTPLTILSVTIDELKSHVPKGFDHYSVMKNNIDRLMRLLQQILEFRKAETGNLKLRVSRNDIVAFVQREVESFIPLMKRKKLHISLVYDPESIIGYFDTDKLDKILYNLLSNAAKYNKEGGFIQINLSYGPDKDHINLVIKDNGHGIEPERQKGLFKRFYEGDYRRFNTTGTGIGLSLTKDLVELHQGTIKVESSIGKGATFIVVLPIDRSFFKEEEIDEMPREMIQPLQNPIPAQLDLNRVCEKENAPTILLIEDNEELLKLMSNLLGREYRILKASNGKEGIVILENEEVDLVVSDIMMPEMDGIEFCKFVKGEIDYCHIPIILLTAKNNEEDRMEAYDSGADAFITKPFHLTVLHARIRNLLKNKERTAKDFKKQLVFEMQELSYTSMDEDFLQRAIQCVHNHLNDSEFDQQQFVEEMGSSKSTLYKKLKSLTGLNTSAFIRNIRLKAACAIAEKNPSIRISELAYAVGFNDPKYFSSCFKKEFGMLPSEYIERFFPETGSAVEDVSSSPV